MVGFKCHFVSPFIGLFPERSRQYRLATPILVDHLATIRTIGAPVVLRSVLCIVLLYSGILF